MITLQEDEFLQLAQKVMSLPTAPFCEDLVSRFVKDFAAQLPTLSLHEDSVGNLLLVHEGTATRRGGPHLVATAHMDHPGLVFQERLSERDFLFFKKGGVPMRFAKEAKVAIYSTHHSPSQPPVGGRITAVIDESAADSGSSPAESGFSVRVARSDGDTIQSGSFAMWNLVAFEKRKRRIRGRACDDLAGVACGLHYLLCLSRANEPVRAGLLLTRAEEIGFGGMAAAVGDLDRENVYVNIECSNAAPAGAVPGDGPIIRVGDRLSIFDPEVTAGMSYVAASLDRDFRFQRKLMDGGACEASMLMQAGFRTGALALPLENYHNNGKKGLRPERIHLDDALGLVKLLVAFATNHDGIDALLKSATQHLKTALDRGQPQHAARLRETMNVPRAADPKEGDDGNG